ncbi:MAG: RIP metalloprotease RseP [Natronospirillum sp.]
MLMTILMFLITLTILIGVHEAGHYWVARWCGVKVLRFSIGFGKPLFGWRNRQGTEFSFAPIPLGGYVKMLDEREGDVAPEEVKYAHNQQPPGRRIAIAAAGPLANFAFAVLMFWIISLLGTMVARPWIEPAADPAQWTGNWPAQPSEIVRVDGQSVEDWREVHLALLSRLGETGRIELRLRTESGAESNVSFGIERWLSRIQDPNPISALGLSFWRPDLPAVVGDLVAGGPAEAAGLMAGDRVSRADGVVIEAWSDLVALIQQRGSEPVSLAVQRGGQTVELTVTPEAVMADDGSTVGRIGVYAAPLQQDNLVRTMHYGPIEGMGVAFGEMRDTVSMTLGFLGKIVSGQASVQNLSGPVSIAQVAGDSASSGVVPFLSFLALLSISLGILNLLPIPVLDGGHILYYLVEIIRGRPLSERAQTIGVQLGMVLLIGVMVIAFTNDFNRF